MNKNELELTAEFAPVEIPVRLLDTKGITLRAMRAEPAQQTGSIVVMSGSAAGILLSSGVPASVRQDAERVLASLTLADNLAQKTADWRMAITSTEETIGRFATTLEDVYLRSIRGWYQAYFVALVILVFLLVYRLA